LNPNRPHFAPWDEREWPRLLSAEEGARRVRIFRQAEERLAELLESWSATVSEPHLQTSLKRHARHAAWHAQLFAQNLGDSDGSTDADNDAATFLDAVASPSGEGETIELLTGVYRVLIPRMITAYTYYQRAIGTEDSDADWRWLDMILKDHFDAIRDGELSLQSLLTGDAEVERSANRKAEPENQMVKTGGLVGPDSLGMATQAGK
jgi:hypothetical protein